MEIWKEVWQLLLFLKLCSVWRMRSNNIRYYFLCYNCSFPSFATSAKFIYYGLLNTLTVCSISSVYVLLKCHFHFLHFHYEVERKLSLIYFSIVHSWNGRWEEFHQIDSSGFSQECILQQYRRRRFWLNNFHMIIWQEFMIREVVK
jgi:hypothetical protein